MKLESPATNKNIYKSSTQESIILSSDPEPLMGEIEEEGVSPDKSEQEEHLRTKVPEAEIHLYRQGKGPVAVFKSALGGWEQDQLQVREDILEKYAMKSVFAFNPTAGGRGVPVRFNPRNGRSVFTYRDGAVVYLDGEPKFHSLSGRMVYCKLCRRIQRLRIHDGECAYKRHSNNKLLSKE